ncbi:uncharacterized protein G2W53_007114 [Senna tora]|uniref:Uncharacterized protein n=1 Tax=Senna tora TaxID=362788 RepID=A0A834X6C4_9FABA|nr:uncharacterized protein G2W53_007114 [Senna tora]
MPKELEDPSKKVYGPKIKPLAAIFGACHCHLIALSKHALKQLNGGTKVSLG